MKNNREDIYTRVTNQIVKAIEEGAKRLRMPWHASDVSLFLPVNAVSKQPYRGINVLTLWALAQTRQYSTGIWATFKQWRQLGARVKEGEKAALVVFWKADEIESRVDEESDKEKGRRLVARGYSVFNAAQVEGYQIPETPKLSESERIEQAEQFFDRLGVHVRHGGSEPYYDIEQDLVWMPEFANFKSAISYYAILAHEATHWTGSKLRLNRSLENRYGTHAYAMEELIAELGAAFVCTRLKLATEPRAEHASYIENWLHALKRDKKAIFTAAAKAQQATDWMLEQVSASKQPVAA